MALWEDPRNTEVDNLPLFLIQLMLVVILTRVLGKVLKLIKQPVVIGEIFGGVILGPSILGQIDGWTDTFFPPKSLAAFGLVANLGLILFMFVLGLEADFSVMRKQAKQAIPLAITSIVAPFAIGATASLWLYNVNGDDNVDYVAFILFFGAAMSFTAFPVLCSILQKANLIPDPLGILAVSCAAIDDVTAWCVLAFASSFARSHNPIDGLYTSLIAIAYAVFMIYGVRPCLNMLHRRFADKREEFGRGYSTVVMITLMFSAYLAQSIGIHAFFGAFLAGIIIPKSGSFAKTAIFKIEMVVTQVLLPLYFANSGLRTNLQSIASGYYVGVTVALITIACLAKFVPACLACKIITKRDWRYCISMGILMNTRGLVELIVLNIGLDLGILRKEMFTMMIIMALSTTFMSPPLLWFFYIRHLPPAKRKELQPHVGFELHAGLGDAPGKPQPTPKSDSRKISGAATNTPASPHDAAPTIAVPVDATAPSAEVVPPTIIEASPRVDSDATELGPATLPPDQIQVAVSEDDHNIGRLDSNVYSDIDSALARQDSFHQRIEFHAAMMEGEVPRNWQ